MRVAILFFITVTLLPITTSADIFINEIAWMGTANSATDEWIELYSSNSENLDGWTLSANDGGMTINLSGSVSAGGFYLIERTDDNTVSNIPADLVAPFGNGLNNTTGEILILKNDNGNEIDRVNASGGWPAGNNSTKETMQKSGSGWTTAVATPKASNSGYIPTPPASPPATQDTAPAPEPEPPPPTPEPEPAPPPAGGAPPTLEPAPTQTPESEPAPVSAPPPQLISEPAPILSPSPTSSPTLAPEPSLQSEAVPDLPVTNTAVIGAPKSSQEPSQPVKDNLRSVNNQELEFQTALVPESLPEEIQSSIFSSSWFWFGMASALGVLSAGAVLALRRFS